METDAISLTWKCGTSGHSQTLSLMKTSRPAVVFPMIEISSVGSRPECVSHKKLISKSNALKKKRTAFELRRLRDHRQEASGGYFNGQLGVKTVPFEECNKDVLKKRKKNPVVLSLVMLEFR